MLLFPSTLMVLRKLSIETCFNVDVDNEARMQKMNHEEKEGENVMSEVRRSERSRSEPNRLMYKTLGNPISLVMHSILSSLDMVVTQVLDSVTPPVFRNLTTI